MLIGAGVRTNSSPVRQIGAPLAGAMERQQWAQAGAISNFHAGEATVVGGAGISAKAAFSVGNLPPACWCMPRKAGGLSSRFNAAMSLGAPGLAWGGVNGTGTSAIAVSVAPAAGQLIAFGVGTAALLLSTNNPLLTAAASGTGTAALAVSLSATLGAEASVAGSSTFELAAQAIVLPADDTPPARSATAAMAFVGALLPYAIGHMTGTTDVVSELTAAAIAAEVIDALEATTIPVDIQRVRGQALQGIGTEGNPWGPA